jgi:transcriptional regulator with XRE-family HTH domain
MDFGAGKIVEAIEEGRIVRVSEEYAKQEGLLILRKASSGEGVREKVDVKKGLGEERRLGFDDYRRPLDWRKNKIIDALIDNFNWEIAKMRKAKNITRKQLATEVGVSENTIKIVENGILPSEDFVLINKIENYLGISLRKDKTGFGGSPREMLNAALNARSRAGEKEEAKKGGGKKIEVEGTQEEVILEFCEQWPVSYRVVACGVDFAALPSDQRPPRPRRTRPCRIPRQSFAPRDRRRPRSPSRRRPVRAGLPSRRRVLHGGHTRGRLGHLHAARYTPY